MNLTDAACQPQHEVSIEKIQQNNNGIINIQLDDLINLEEDLDFYEKVSLF